MPSTSSPKRKRVLVSFCCVYVFWGGTYLAMRLNEGGSLHDALERMLVDLDGSFSCLVATDTEFGFIRDPFALKPLCFTETDGFAAVATEEIALRAAIPGDYSVREAQAKEVRVWRR